MTDDPSPPRQFIPLGLDLQEKNCLVIGGGDVGTRKALTLSRAGAIVTVVAPAVTDELAAQIRAGRIRWVEDSFRKEHLCDAFLVVAATDDDDLNAAIGRLAAQSRTLVCDASSAERSEVIFGALLEKDDVTVAVFTGGRDPARARQTRDRIAGLLGEEKHHHSDKEGAKRSV